MNMEEEEELRQNLWGELGLIPANHHLNQIILREFEHFRIRLAVV